MRLEFDEPQREQLEIAALLHDVGIVGAPDHVLLKPARLDSEEMAVMTRARSMSLEILRRSCTSTEILKIVGNVSTLVRRQQRAAGPKQASRSRWRRG